MDYMRPDIVALLRGSDSSYVRELIGMDPVAVFRWAMLRAAIHAMAVLREAGRLRAERAEKAAGKRRGPRPSRRAPFGGISHPRHVVQPPPGSRALSSSQTETLQAHNFTSSPSQGRKASPCFPVTTWASLRATGL